MEMPLLQTKLYIPPPQPDLIIRERLLSRLNEGLQRKLTLISAPAGYGKSTLISSWLQPLQQASHQIGWVSLDEDDNDALEFFRYLTAAVDRFSGCGQTIQIFLQSQGGRRPKH